MCRDGFRLLRARKAGKVAARVEELELADALRSAKDLMAPSVVGFDVKTILRFSHGHQQVINEDRCGIGDYLCLAAFGPDEDPGIAAPTTTGALLNHMNAVKPENGSLRCEQVARPETLK